MPHKYASKNPWPGEVGANSMGASSCNAAAGRARKSAISSGVTAIHDKQYKSASGKITTCKTADTTTSPQALESMRRTSEE